MGCVFSNEDRFWSPMIPELEHGVFVIMGSLLVVATAPLLMELLVVTLAAMVGSSKSGSSGLALPPLGRMVILVPSHNEELTIARCVKSLAASAGGTGDILVIAHNCTDGTAERAAAAGAMVSVLNDPDLPGKGNALKHGFRIVFQDLAADAALIVDADSTVSDNLVPCVRQRLEHTLVLQCWYDCRSGTGNPQSRLRALAFFCMNVVRPMGRQQLHLSSGLFGNGFALRRQVIEQVPYQAHSIVEDLEFHLCLLAAGIHSDFVDEARVWGEVPSAAKATTTQSARWEGGRLRMLRCHGPALLLQVLRGRLRLIEPLLDLAGLPIANEVVALLLLLLLPLPGLRLYALAGVAILSLHLLFAVYIGPDPSADLRALVQAPMYVAAKVAMLPAIIRMTRSRAAWVRTSRAGAPK
jgi:cellulose synthase/poly-beta-1,6-N-acetylglucosamine synthase-like glycosyltransferase